MKNFFLTLLLLHSLNLIGQVDNEKNIYLSSNLAWIPHEIKYGSIFQNRSYNNQFYISSYIIGQVIKKEEGVYSFLSPGISYSRMFDNNYISIFPYYGKSIWYSNYGIKAEPLFNLRNNSIEYVNIEISAALILGLSLSFGIPTNKNINNPFWGFKIGYAFYEPIFLTKKTLLKN